MVSTAANPGRKNTQIHDLKKDYQILSFVLSCCGLRPQTATPQT
jgi:hypothetical protein